MGRKNYAYINKDMLIWARSITPFTTVEKVELYKKDIKAEKLILWERGDELPSITEAKSLASLYKVPLACFFLPFPPQKKPKNYADRRTYGGTVYRETSYELWCEIDRLTNNRNLMVEYLDEDDNYPTLPIFGSDTTLKTIAETVRQFLGINPPYKSKNFYKGNAFNYFRGILENKGIMVSQISGVSLDEMKGISIYYDTFPIIAVNKNDFERAKVFSLFHELAHLIRRSSSLCLIDFDERNDDEEKLCDKIAAEILMPEEQFITIAKLERDVYSDWTSFCLRTIGDYFAVSSFSVIRRLYELKMISFTDYQLMYNSLLKEFEEKRMTIEMGKGKGELRIKYFIKYLSKEGYLFPKTIISAYYKGNLSYGELCQKLSINSKHIANLEQAVMLR